MENEFSRFLLEVDKDRNLEEIRRDSEDNILTSQLYNKKYYVKNIKKPTLYKKEDFVYD